MAVLDVGIAPVCVETDPREFGEHTRDLSGIHRVRPQAVAHPDSPAEVAEVVHWCHRAGLRWQPQGTRHSMGGQALAPGGVHISTRQLNQIRDLDLDEGSIEVEAGVDLHEIITTAAAYGLRLTSATPSYTRLSVGGVASVGGVSPLPTVGALVDHITQIELATPDGSLLRLDRGEALFHQALASRGAAGVLTRLRLQLTRMPRLVHTWHLHYPATNMPAAVADLSAAARADGVDEALLMLGGTDLSTATLALTSYDDPARAEDVLRTLHPQSQTGPDTGDYVSHCLALEQLYDQPDWLYGCRKVWTDVWLPEDSVADYTAHAATQLDDRAFSSTSYGLVFAKPRRAFRTGRLRLPEPVTNREDELVYLVDLLRDDFGRQGDPAWSAAMHARHHHAVDEARRCGGVVYPIGSTTMGDD